MWRGVGRGCWLRVCASCRAISATLRVVLCGALPPPFTKTIRSQSLDRFVAFLYFCMPKCAAASEVLSPAAAVEAGSSAFCRMPMTFALLLVLAVLLRSLVWLTVVKGRAITATDFLQFCVLWC